MFGTGVRLGEAVSLRVQDIAFDTITVRGKGQKVRQIYLPQATREALIEYLKVRIVPSAREDSAYLFTTKAGKRMSHNYFRKICQELRYIEDRYPLLQEACRIGMTGHVRMKLSSCCKGDVLAYLSKVIV